MIKIQDTNIVKCPNCGSDTIKIVVANAHVAEFECRNFQCLKHFCKEYK